MALPITGILAKLKQILKKRNELVKRKEFDNEDYAYLLKICDRECLVDHAADSGVLLDALHVIDCQAEHQVHEDDGHVDDEEHEDGLGHPKGLGVGERVGEVVFAHKHGQHLRNEVG